MLVLSLALVLFVGLPSTEALADEQLVVVTWNIKWFFDDDTSDDTSNIGKGFAAPSLEEYQERASTVVDAIADIDPDILALQEMENEKVVQDLADELASEYGLNYQVAFKQGRDTQTGQDVAYLVRDDFSFTDQRIEYEFSGNGDFKNLSKHLLLQTTVGSEPLSLINIHLIASSPGGRIRQARTLRSWAEDLGIETENLIILGDFNSRVAFNATTPESDTGIIRGFQTPGVGDDFFDTQQNLVDRSTTPDGSPLDRIFLSPSLVENPNLIYLGVETREDLAIRGSKDGSGGVKYEKPVEEQDLSDHYPVVATFSY